MNLRAAPNRAQHCFAWIEKHTKLCSKDVFPSGFPPPAPREGKGTPPLQPGLWEPGGQRGGVLGCGSMCCAAQCRSGSATHGSHGALRTTERKEGEGERRKKKRRKREGREENELHL